MVEGKIYWCKLCEKLIRFETECQDCGTAGDAIGWLKVND
jgi:predicted RNA-binding protein with PUA domain